MSTFFTYAWVLIALFLLTNFILVSIYRKKYKGRIFILPHMENKTERIYGLLNISINIGLIAYSFFIPLKLDVHFLTVGLSIYALGFIFYAMSMMSYANFEGDKPATKGVYKISRHPMQVSTVFVFLGIGVAALSYLYIILSFTTLFVMYPNLISQENYCIKRYGDDYLKYMKNSPRYLFFI